MRYYFVQDETSDMFYSIMAAREGEAEDIVERVLRLSWLDNETGEGFRLVPCDITDMDDQMREEAQMVWQRYMRMTAMSLAVAAEQQDKNLADEAEENAE